MHKERGLPSLRFSSPWRRFAGRHGYLILYHSGARVWHRSVERLDCQQNARTAVEMIDRELRFADWIEIPQANEIRYRPKGDFGYGRVLLRRFRLLRTASYRDPRWENPASKVALGSTRFISKDASVMCRDYQRRRHRCAINLQSASLRRNAADIP